MVASESRSGPDIFSPCLYFPNIYEKYSLLFTVGTIKNTTFLMSESVL